MLVFFLALVNGVRFAHSRPKLTVKARDCETFPHNAWTSTDRCDADPKRTRKLQELVEIDSVNELASYIHGSQHLRKIGCSHAYPLLNCMAGAEGAEVNLGEVWEELNDEKQTGPGDTGKPRPAFREGDARRRGGVMGRENLSGLWADGVIVYKIDNHQELKRIWREATDYIKKYTCLDFKKAPRSQKTGYVHVLHHNGGCNAIVGFWRGSDKPSTLKMGTRCMKTGTLIHEILHVAGFWHEQSRGDRDQHIKMLWHNIKKGEEGEFSKEKDLDLPSPYDFSSLMHYGPWGFSIGYVGGEHPTMVNMQNQPIVAGQRHMMSQQDVDQLNYLYKFTCKKSVPRNVGIITFPLSAYSVACTVRGQDHYSSREDDCGRAIYNDNSCRTNIFAFKAGTCACCTDLAKGYVDGSREKMFFVVGPSSEKTVSDVNGNLPVHPLAAWQNYKDNKVNDMTCYWNKIGATRINGLALSAETCDKDPNCGAIWDINCGGVQQYLCQKETWKLGADNKKTQYTAQANECIYRRPLSAADKTENARIEAEKKKFADRVKTYKANKMDGYFCHWNKLNDNRKFKLEDAVMACDADENCRGIWDLKCGAWKNYYLCQKDGGEDAPQKKRWVHDTNSGHCTYSKPLNGADKAAKEKEDAARAQKKQKAEKIKQSFLANKLTDTYCYWNKVSDKTYYSLDQAIKACAKNAVCGGVTDLKCGLWKNYKLCKKDKGPGAHYKQRYSSRAGAGHCTYTKPLTAEEKAAKEKAAREKAAAIEKFRKRKEAYNSNKMSGYYCSHNKVSDKTYFDMDKAIKACDDNSECGGVWDMKCGQWGNYKLCKRNGDEDAPRKQRYVYRPSRGHCTFTKPLTPAEKEAARLKAEAKAKKKAEAEARKKQLQASWTKTQDYDCYYNKLSSKRYYGKMKAIKACEKDSNCGAIWDLFCGSWGQFYLCQKEQPSLGYTGKYSPERGHCLWRK